MPPHLTRPPGTTSSMPGVFKYSSGIVHVVDLRNRFGVEEEDKKEPGRIVVVEIEGGHAGIWVDEIIDVIQLPSRGWGQVPSHIPRHVFTRTLLLDKKIFLYADFENLHKFRETGYLRQHIEMLKKDVVKKKETTDPGVKRATSFSRPDDIKSVSEQYVENSDVDRNEQDAVSQAEKESEVKSQNPSPFLSNNKQTKPVTDRNVISDAVPGKAIAGSALTRAIPSQKPEQREITAAQSNNELRRNDTQRRSLSKTGLQKKPEKPQDSISTANERYTQFNDKTPNDFSGKKDDTGMEVAAENNMVLWGFGLVILALVFMLYFSSEKLFPENENRQDEVVLDVRQEIAADTGDEVVIQRESNDKPTDEINLDAQTVISQDVANTQSVAPYRAEIAHDKNEIVIVLQQPEEETDVFKSSQKLDSEMEAGEQDANIPLAEEMKLKNEDQNKNDILVGQVRADTDNSLADQSAINATGHVIAQEADFSEKANASAVLTEQVIAKKAVVIKKVIHVVVKGDTLWHIAERYIKDPFKYPELARLSKIKNPDLIYPGNKVIIIMESKKSGID